jgi:hypothetical protein
LRRQTLIASDARLPFFIVSQAAIGACQILKGLRRCFESLASNEGTSPVLANEGCESAMSLGSAFTPSVSTVPNHERRRRAKNSRFSGLRHPQRDGLRSVTTSPLPPLGPPERVLTICKDLLWSQSAPRQNYLFASTAIKLSSGFRSINLL